ncbi:MAG: RNA-binding protein [Alphaproteobacteria bacterium]
MSASATCADDRADTDRGDAGDVQRRCLVTGERRDKGELIRFVVGPGAVVVPDLDAVLPGRGLWVTGQRVTVADAVKRRAFSRGAKAAVTAPDDLADRLGTMLTERLINAVALARRAGDAICGYEKVRAVLRSGRASVLLSARDRQAEGARKMRALAQAMEAAVPMVDLLDAEQLGRPFGRADSVHAVIATGAMTAKVMGAAERLAHYLGCAPIERIGGGDSEAR